MKNVIVDLDGTLALDHHRNHLLHIPCPETGDISLTEQGRNSHENCKKCHGAGKWHNWTEYFDLCHKDSPNYPVVYLVRLLKSMGHPVFILSGRSDVAKEKTLAWLDVNLIAYDEIKLRPAMCRTDDDELKIRWGQELSPPDQTLFVLEDRSRVVAAWRNAGYTCLQVAPGTF